MSLLTSLIHNIIHIILPVNKVHLKSVGSVSEYCCSEICTLKGPGHKLDFSIKI